MTLLKPKNIIILLALTMASVAFLPSPAALAELWIEGKESEEINYDFTAKNSIGSKLEMAVSYEQLQDNLRTNISQASFATTYNSATGENKGTFKWKPSSGTVGEYFPIVLTIIDPSSGAVEYVNFGVRILGRIYITANPQSGHAPLSVTFTASAPFSVTSWQWSFGDGGTSSFQSPTHTYDNAGVFTAKVTANPGEGFSDSASITIIVDSAAPEPDFTATPRTGTAPLDVQFIDQTSGDIERRLWDFGDDSRGSTDKDPLYTYINPGIYSVELTVIDADGSAATKRKQDYINVTYPVLRADFTASARAGVSFLTVNFYDLSIGKIDKWTWDFGDNTPIKTGQNQTHTYSSPGNYTVKLKVEGPGGADEEIKENYITVSYPPPQADFTASPRSVQEFVPVNFTNLSTGNITEYSWDFGDGSSRGYERNPAHTYYSAGTYTVTLTVAGPGGTDIETKIDYIIVENPIPVAYFSIRAGYQTTGEAPHEVCFDNYSIGNITRYVWDFGDSFCDPADNTSNDSEPAHTYYYPGTYTVKLSVYGETESDMIIKEDYITVTSQYIIPQADFSGYPRTGEGELTVAFTNNSTGDVTAWLWSFGDGTVSIDKNPIHQYIAPGTYTVTLSATGPAGYDIETKEAYIVINEDGSRAPLIFISSPADNSGVSEQYVKVEGYVSDSDLESVEVKVYADMFVSTWIPAEVTGSDFTCTVEIPTDGTSAIIMAKAADSADNTSIDNVRVIYGYVRLIGLPYYYAKNENARSLSGIAVVKGMLDLMRPEPDDTFPADEAIYQYGHNYNLDSNSPLNELDAEGMAAALGHYDIYDLNGDPTGFGDKWLGYNFHVYSMENTPEGFAEYLKEIVHWMSWPVVKGSPYTSDGTDLTNEPYVPVVLPLYADVEGYSRWIIANGCAASIDPFEGKEAPWKYGRDSNDITVHGLFLTDPEASGIGKDVYIASSELANYLKPMPSAAISGKYGDTASGVDKYAGRYLMVADPPEEECGLNAKIAEPIINKSTLALIRLAEYINEKSAEKFAKHLADSALLVKLDESEAVRRFSTDADLAALFKRRSDTENESVICWKDIVDPMLLLNEDFKRAVSNSVAREFIKVHRIDTGKDYYIIPFDKFTRGRFRSYAAIIVDAKDGHFVQASYVNKPTRYIQMTKEEAIERVTKDHPEATTNNIKTRLVWKAGELTASPFHPYWEVTAGAKIYHVVGE